MSVADQVKCSKLSGSADLVSWLDVSGSTDLVSPGALILNCFGLDGIVWLLFRGLSLLGSRLWLVIL